MSIYPLVKRPQLSEERLREMREAIEMLVRDAAYVSEQELLYGKPLSEGNWDDIAADVPLSKRGFGT